MTKENEAEKRVPVPERKAIRVSNVLDDDKIVLTCGREHGTKLTDRFLIYGIGPDIIDPETGENLGALELVRGVGKVSHIQDRFCTVVSDTKVKIPGRKRVVKRSTSGLWSFSEFARDPVEEIIEGERTTIQSFEDAAVGDYARKLT